MKVNTTLSSCALLARQRAPAQPRTHFSPPVIPARGPIKSGTAVSSPSRKTLVPQACPTVGSYGTNFRCSRTQHKQFRVSGGEARPKPGKQPVPCQLGHRCLPKRGAIQTPDQPVVILLSLVLMVVPGPDNCTSCIVKSFRSRSSFVSSRLRTP